MEKILCQHCGKEIRKIKWTNMHHLSFWVHMTGEEARAAYLNPLTDRERMALRWCQKTMAAPHEGEPVKP